MAAGGAYPKPNSASHVLPGEFVYKGVLFCNNYPLKAIQRIESDLQFNDDDVMVVTYPKSGKYCWNLWTDKQRFLTPNVFGLSHGDAAVLLPGFAIRW